MCAREFIYYLNQMVENHWRYPPTEADYGMTYLDEEGIGEVDCVGVYRYIMKWYYTENSYNTLFSGNSVYRLFNDGMKSTGKLTDPTWLLPGMAVFEYDPNYSKYEYYCWRHVAYYIGYTEEYGHTIIESYSAGKEMRMTTLDTDRYNYYGWLKGIDYCVSDAIECR